MSGGGGGGGGGVCVCVQADPKSALVSLELNMRLNWMLALLFHTKGF